MDQSVKLRRLRQEWLRETRRELTQLAMRMVELRDREQRLLFELKQDESARDERE